MPAAVAMPFTLGLTGGIGSGKSTVAALLQQRGAGLVDADAIARACTAAGGDAIAPIAAALGTDFIAADGALDRDRMRSHVFAHPAARLQLESIIHPLVVQRMQAQAAALTQGGHRCIVMDIPLLVESGRWRQRLHRVLVVDCSESTQVSRVVQRSGLAAAEVERIMASQAARMQRLRAADIVLCNDGISLDQLAAQVHQMATQFGL